MDNTLTKLLIAGGSLLILVIVMIIFGLTIFFNGISNPVSAQESSKSVELIQPKVAVNDPITILKIVNSPVVYKDIPLTVEGKIDGWVTKRAIIVTEFGEKNGGKKLLVIRDQNFGLPSDIPVGEVALGEIANVSLTGRTGILNLSEGDLSFGDEAENRELRQWNNKPVIFASAVVQK